VTVAERRRLDAVAALGCCVCGQPAVIHHVPPARRRPGDDTGAQRDHRYVLALCPAHHSTQHGVGIHGGVETWEAEYGPQAEWLGLVDELLSRDGTEVFGPAENAVIESRYPWTA